MVYSPGPASPVTMGDRNGGLYGRTNRSVSPGTAAGAAPMAAGSSAPQSKRDKRRTQLQERLYDLTVTFNQNRDSQFRQQLHGLQCDMTLINNTDPYEAGPLPDSAEEIAQLIETTVGGGQFGKEMASISGGWYSKFVQEINEIKEDRDVELVAVMNRYREAVKRYDHEFSWRQRFAREEFRLLSSTLRERLVQKVSANKTRLMREKEQMDISDTNALLLNPNQFTITHPSSPGGIHGNRKTRHTRHRIGIDEFGNGIGMEANRRKRKAPDDDVGSPARDAGLSTPAERTKAAAEKQQTDKVYSINSLFTDKELALHANQAHIATAHFFSTSRNQDGVGSALNGSNSDEMDDADSATAAAAALDDGGTPAAADMARTASQSYHATRSTRNQGNTGLNLLAELSDKPATRPNLPYHILANHNSRTTQSAPPLNSLMNDEIDDDLSRMDRLQAKPHGWIDRGLIDTITELVPDDVDGPVAANGDRFSLLHAEFPIEMGIKWYSKSNAGSYEMFPQTNESSAVVNGNKRRN